LKALVSISNKRKERVFLLGVELESRPNGEMHESLAELSELAVTADGDVIAQATKN